MVAVAGETLSLDLAEIRDRREKLGLTLEQAAAAAGFKSGRQFWYMLESGRRPDVPLSTVTKIAAALNCKPSSLLKEEK